MKKPDNIFYIYMRALTEKYGMQRVTVNLPDGRTAAGLVLFNKEWQKDKMVPVERKSEPDISTENAA